MPSKSVARGTSGFARAAAAAALAVGLLLSVWSGWQIWSVSGLPGALTLAGVPAGALLLAAGLTYFTPTGRRLGFWMYGSLALFLPLYGSLGNLALFFALRSGRGGDLARDLAEEMSASEADMDDSSETGGAGTLDQRVWRELNVQSYMDIMRGPDRNLKKSLIGKILSEWTPNSVALLRQALEDEEYEIRSYACTALTEIENRINESILRRRRDLEAGSGDVASLLDLVAAYLDYAQSGLLDRASASHYAGMARDLLNRIDDDGVPEGRLRQVLILSGQLARLTDDGPTERDAYEQLLSRWPDDREALLHKCALDFRQRRLADLRHSATALLDGSPADHPAVEAARLWTGPPAAPASAP